MKLPSRHIIRNSIPGCSRPGTVPLGIGCTDTESLRAEWVEKTLFCFYGIWMLERGWFATFLASFNSYTTLRSVHLQRFSIAGSLCDREVTCSIPNHHQMNPVSVGWGHLIHLTRPVARMRQLPRLSSPFFVFFVTENSQKFWVIRPFGSPTGPRFVWFPPLARGLLIIFRMFSWSNSVCVCTKVA